MNKPEHPDYQRRLEVALRLKALRHIMGSTNHKGQAVAISTKALSTLPVLVENRITKNRIEEIEQMKIDARPYELQILAATASLPADWFAGRLDAATRFANATRLEAQRQRGLRSSDSVDPDGEDEAGEGQ